jgi:hypothetical protein
LPGAAASSRSRQDCHQSHNDFDLITWLVIKMSNNKELKQAISQRIQAFASQRLRQSALALLRAWLYLRPHS